MLRYDSTNIFDTVGGLQPSAFRSMSPRLKKAKQAVLKMSQEGIQGFLSLPKEHEHFDECHRVLSALPKACTDLIVLGIGRSDLGGHMLLEAVGCDKGMRVQFGGSTTAPDEVH